MWLCEEPGPRPLLCQPSVVKALGMDSEELQCCICFLPRPSPSLILENERHGLSWARPQAPSWAELELPSKLAASFLVWCFELLNPLWCRRVWGPLNFTASSVLLTSLPGTREANSSCCSWAVAAYTFHLFPVDGICGPKFKSELIFRGLWRHFLQIGLYTKVKTWMKNFMQILYLFLKVLGGSY